MKETRLRGALDGLIVTPNPGFEIIMTAWFFIYTNLQRAASIHYLRSSAKIKSYVRQNGALVKKCRLRHLHATVESSSAPTSRQPLSLLQPHSAASILSSTALVNSCVAALPPKSRVLDLL